MGGHHTHTHIHTLTPTYWILMHPPTHPLLSIRRRKKDREAKKFSKQVAAERAKEKAQGKKAAITGISKLRKQREKSVSEACCCGGGCGG